MAHSSCGWGSLLWAEWVTLSFCRKRECKGTSPWRQSTEETFHPERGEGDLPWHQTDLSQGLAQPEQTHSESDPWHSAWHNDLSKSEKPGQAETPLSSIWQHQLSTGLSSWMSRGLHYYTLIHTLIFQVSHKIFLKAALMTNLSHVQHKETTAQVAEC